MQDGNEKAISGLIDILRLERDVIRKADFDAIRDLAERKEAVLAELKDVAPERLRQAQKMSEQNHKLLVASLRGIRAAQVRLSEIQRAVRSFTSYDAYGRGQTISSSAGSVEKRA